MPLLFSAFQDLKFKNICNKKKRTKLKLKTQTSFLIFFFSFQEALIFPQMGEAATANSLNEQFRPVSVDFGLFCN